MASSGEHRNEERMQMLAKKAAEELEELLAPRRHQRSSGILNRIGPARQAMRPWQCLYFLPDPQGHGALRAMRHRWRDRADRAKLKPGASAPAPRRWRSHHQPAATPFPFPPRRRPDPRAFRAFPGQAAAKRRAQGRAASTCASTSSPARANAPASPRRRERLSFILV